MHVFVNVSLIPWETLARHLVNQSAETDTDASGSGVERAYMTYRTAKDKYKAAKLARGYYTKGQQPGPPAGGLDEQGRP